MRQLLLIFCFFSINQVMAQSSEVKFGTKSSSKYEKGTVNRMEQMLKMYDLSRWIFTDTVVVEDNAIPHSHPVLTLSTRRQNDDGLLSTFLHEQIHWFAESNNAQVNDAISSFKKTYTNVPVGGRDGARDEHSTYLHLIVSYLEYQSMIEVVGPDRAKEVIEKSNHYRWIYRTVLDDTTQLGKVIKKHGLNFLNK